MDFVDQLKSQLDIVDVVGHYVRLKRNGASPRHVGYVRFIPKKLPRLASIASTSFISASDAMPRAIS